jgi:hypothetical protein
MSKYFFIDYDNTLFSHRTMSVPESAIHALLELQRAGHKVILASGRPFQGDVSEYLGTEFIPDGISGANGAILEAGGKLIYETHFDRDVQNRLIDFAMERNYCLMSSYKGCWYATSLERLKELHVDGVLKESPKCGDEFLALKDKPLFSFFIADVEDAIQDLQEHFPEVKVLRMGDRMGGADVVPAGNGKAEGMRRLLEYFGADVHDAIAIGDSMNDMEIIQAAGLGIAMGNAMPMVKAAADYVAKDIDEGGLADAVRYALMSFSN